MMSEDDIRALAARFAGVPGEALKGDDLAELLEEILSGTYTELQLFEVFWKNRMREIEHQINAEDLIDELTSDIESLVRRTVGRHVDEA